LLNIFQIASELPKILQVNKGLGAVKITDIKIARHEIAGHEIDGPTCRAWNCRTWQEL